MALYSHYTTTNISTTTTTCFCFVFFKYLKKISKSRVKLSRAIYNEKIKQLRSMILERCPEWKWHYPTVQQLTGAEKVRKIDLVSPDWQRSLQPRFLTKAKVWAPKTPVVSMAIGTKNVSSLDCEQKCELISSLDRAKTFL